MSETKCLDSSLNRFWDLETLCIKEHDGSVLENFNGTICFNQEDRCKVKLPFKETRDILHDLFALCEKRLLKLYSNLKNDIVLLKNYNDIFSYKMELGVIEETKQSVEPSNCLANKEQILNKTKTAVLLTSSKQVSSRNLKNVFIMEKFSSSFKLYRNTEWISRFSTS